MHAKSVLMDAARLMPRPNLWCRLSPPSRPRAQSPAARSHTHMLGLTVAGQACRGLQLGVDWKGNQGSTTPSTVMCTTYVDNRVLHGVLNMYARAHPAIAATAAAADASAASAPRRSSGAAEPCAATNWAMEVRASGRARSVPPASVTSTAT